MITSNVIHRVFRLKYREQTGTSFIINVDDNQYFVTAKHVVQVEENDDILHSLSVGEEVEIFRDNSWHPIPVTVVAHSEISDVSIFKIKQNIPAHPMPATTDGIFYGQDVYFLGFPYGLSSVVGEINRHFPLPLVKKGILSSMFNVELGGMFFVDGHNNPGFSGGPVIFTDQKTKEQKVAGIIHGYQPEFKNIAGRLTPIENTNSSIIIAYSISNAIDLIEAL